MAVAAELGADALEDALLLGAEPGLVLVAGTASVLPPSFGTHHEWITSEEVMSSVTVVFTGTYIVWKLKSWSSWPS